MSPLETATNGTAISWIKISEASKLSGLAQPTLYQLIQKGSLPVERKKIDEVLHLDKEAFENWVKNRPRRGKKTRNQNDPAQVVSVTVDGSALPIPSSAPTTLDFWLKVVQFVRERQGKVALQTDGKKTVLVEATE